MADSNVEEFEFNNPESWEAAVFQALGAASVCWDPKPTGVFDPEQAEKIGNSLIAYIKDKW